MKKGVLLINLGTPASPTPTAVREYLKRFLSDPRVIDMPAWKWKPILNTMILPHRPAKSAELYRQIWSKENGSPLLYYTQQQAQQLQELLPEHEVRFAMSYSHPLIATELERFDQNQITDLTIIPMYPQYSTTTVGSVVDDINRFYLERIKIPNLRVITDFCDFKPYIKALAAKIKAEIANFNPDQILFSYHGIPQSYVTKGDPYQERCETTTKLLRAELATEIPIQQTYQSRFGPDEWLKPATDETLKQLPANGTKRVLVVAPSFVADCLETLHELDVENRDYFLTNGGEDFRLVPALNADESFTQVLRQLVLNLR
jgi:ferrochelatase